MDENTNKRLGELIKRLIKDDTLALCEINAIMEKILRAIGNIYYTDKADVDDAISDTYIRIIKKARRFKKNDNACGWIVSIFRNIIKNKLKRKNREQQYLQEIILTVANAQSLQNDYFERRLFLNDIMSRLNEDEQELLIKYYLVGYTIRELGEQSGKSKSMIHKQLTAIIEKLKQNFNE